MTGRETESLRRTRQIGPRIFSAEYWGWRQSDQRAAWVARADAERGPVGCCAAVTPGSARSGLLQGFWAAGL